MDRIRRHPNRRKPFGNPSSTSPRSPSEPSFGRQSSSTSPVMSHASGPASASAAASPHGRRASKPLQHAFTFSTPGSARNPSLRKRSRTVDNYSVADGDDEDVDDDNPDGPRKGGHSLRKRARVDYTFEHIDDEVVVPASTSAPRTGRKRRSDGTDESEDFYGTGPRRRLDTASPDTPSTRRRNPSRKSIEARTYKEEFGEDNPETKDTIEVGGSYSDIDEADLLQAAHSTTSSPDQPLPSSEHAANGIAENDTFYGPFAENYARSIKQQTPESAIQTAVDATNHEPQMQQDYPAIPLQQESSTLQAKTEDLSDVYDSSTYVTEQPFGIFTQPPPVVTQEQIQQQAEEPVAATQQPIAVDPALFSINETPSVNNPESPQQASDQPLQAAKHEEPVDFEGPPTVQSSQAPPPSQALPTSPTSPTAQSSQSLPTSESRPTDEPLPASEPLPSSEPPPTAELAPEQAAVSLPDPRSAAVSIVGQPGQESEPIAEAMDIDEAPETQSAAPASLTKDSRDSLADVKSTDTEPTAVEEPVQAETVAPAQSTPVRTVSEAPPEKELSRLPVIPQSTETELPPKTGKPAKPSRPQPTPIGRWSHLTPYVDGDFVSYPAKKIRSDDEGTGEDQPSEEKEADKDGNDMEPMVEESEETPEVTMGEVPTPALNTPTRGSPALDSMDPTAFNSPAPAGEEPDDVDVSESQEPPETRRYFKYRKLRDADDYIKAIENFEEMSTAELWDILEACNVSLVQWQSEYTQLGKTVDDYENSQRRRLADSKYESRTRNLRQHGINYDEPDFATKGYKAKEKETMSETRYLQSQDRIMAATYGFEYDPHPSKIGRQNPETQQVGIMTRGRSLRNQPKQTAKATEADEVVGKRHRKAVQLFDPATQQDVSRSSTPVPSTRGRRRRTANMDNDDNQLNITSSFNEELPSDGEAAPRRGRKRGPRPRGAPTVEVMAPDTPRESPSRDEPARSGRRGRGRATEYENSPFRFVEAGPEPSPKPSKRSNRTDTGEPRQPKRMLTLKMPPNPKSGSASVITDNGDSPRPSTASSESSTHTAESSYSFRPKRQKRFRDDPDDMEALAQGPPKKRGKRANTVDDFILPSEYATPEAHSSQGDRKVHKIKIVRNAPEPSRNGTPVSLPATDDGGERKDYKAMTKSEKMSASMKSRWANGNMAGAVEKRKATLAAKKAAQAAAEQRVGLIAPKPNTPKPPKVGKKETPVQAQGPPPEWAPGIPGMGYPFPTNYEA